MHDAIPPVAPGRDFLRSQLHSPATPQGRPSSNMVGLFCGVVLIPFAHPGLKAWTEGRALYGPILKENRIDRKNISQGFWHQ